MHISINLSTNLAINRLIETINFPQQQQNIFLPTNILLNHVI